MSRRFEKYNDDQNDFDDEKQYGSMIFLSNEAERNIEKMSDQELDLLADFLAYSLSESINKIQEDLKRKENER